MLTHIPFCANLTMFRYQISLERSNKMGFDKNVLKFNSYMLRLSHGDIKALEKIYYDFGGLFFSYARSYLFDKQLAEDLLSDAMCKLVSKAQLFDAHMNGLNWALKMIKNEAISINKKCSQTTPFDNIPAENIQSILQSLSQTNERQELIAAIELLDDKERKLLYQKYWEGYTIREIAEFWEIPSSTIQYQVKSILKKIKLFISNYEK